MKVSVVMTTYNGEKYILPQLESLLNQTRRADEVLIYDDGSSDRTIEIVNDFLDNKNLTNWRLIINKINKGWRRNFFDGICEAEGDIVFPCDQDDVWFEKKIEIMENVMKDHNEIELLVSGFTTKLDNIGNKGKVDNSIKKISLTDNIFVIPYPGCTYCIRKTLIHKTRNYWRESFPHDAFFWRMALMTDGLYALNNRLMIWRIHETSSFAIEKSSNSSISKKKEWISYAYETIDSLSNYIEKDSCQNVRKKRLVLEKNRNWLNLRSKLFTTKKIINWFLLIRYIKIYPQRKQYLYDLYYVLRK